MTLEAYQQRLAATDNSYQFIVLVTALFVVTGVLLWRSYPRFQRAAEAAGPMIVPGLTLPFSPLLAVLNFAIAHLPTPTLSNISPALITVIALVMRLPKMVEPLWFDEIFTHRLATLPLEQFARAILADVHPPLYPALLWVWGRLVGFNDVVMRLPSLLIGLAGVWLLYRLALATGLTRRAALLAALLYAVMPSAIYYSTELRAYGLLSVAVMGALVALLERRSTWFIVACGLAGAAHHVGAIYVFVIVWAALCIRRQQHFSHAAKWYPTLAAGLLIACLCVPLALLQSGAVGDGYWMRFNLSTALRPLILNIFFTTPELALIVPIPFIGLTLLSFWVARRWLFSDGIPILMVALFVPCILVLASVAWTPIYKSAALLPCTLLTLIPLAIALEKRLILSVAAPVLFSALVGFYSGPIARTDYAAQIAQGCEGATAMYYTDLDMAFTADHSWEASSLVWPAAQDKNGVLSSADMPAYGFQLGSLSSFTGQAVCIPFADTPLTFPQERSYLAMLRMIYPHRVTVVHVQPDLVMRYFVFEL